MDSKGLQALFGGMWEGAVESVKGIKEIARTIAALGPAGNSAELTGQLTQALMNMGPQQRRAAIRHVGGLIGAGTGAVSGAGLASIPLAGGGAVVGEAAGDYVATLLGIPRDKPVSGLQGIREVGKTFGANATGQAMGEGVAALPRAVPMARNTLKRPFTPSAEQAATNALADKHNIPMTVAQRSGRTLPQLADAALDATPLGSGPIRAGREAAQTGAEAALNRTKDTLHPTPISPDSFVANEAKGSLATQRSTLNADVNAAANTAGATLHPVPVAPYEGGRAMQGANDAAWGRFRNAAAAKFQPFLADNGGLIVDVPNLREAATHLLTNEISPAAQGYFPSNTLKQLKGLAGMSDTVTGDLGAEIDKVAKGFGLKNAAELEKAQPELVSRLRAQFQKDGLGVSTPPTMTLQQLIDLRSRLLEMGRNATSATPGITRRSLGQIRGEVEAAIDTALAGKPQLQEFRDINNWYRQNISHLDNDAAGIIKGTKFPEDIVTKNQIAQPGADERIVQAHQSTGLTGEGIDKDAVGKFRRANFDQARNNAQVDIGLTGTSRLSPAAFKRYLEQLTGRTTRELYSPSGATAVEGVAAPGLIAREGQVFGSPMANAIDTGNAQTVMGQAFPKQNPGAVQDAIQFFDRTGDSGALRRSSLQNLEDRALATDRNIDASKRYLDFYRLEREMGPGTGWGNSTEAMFGPQANSEIGEITRVGKALGAPSRNFGNTSRTTHVAHALGAAGAAGAAFLHPSALPWLASGGAAVYGAGKAMASPRVAKWLTSPLEALPAANGAVANAVGAAVRVPYAANLDELRELPTKEPPKDWFELNKPPEDGDAGDDWFSKHKPPE